MTLFLTLIFSGSFILTYLVKLMAEKKQLLDIPNERSSHTVSTPRGGGMAIAIVWFFGISYLFYFDKIESELYYALMTGVLIAIVSFLDDIFTLKSTPRMLVQALSTAIALYFIGGLSEIDFGFFTLQNQVVLNGIAFIGILWFINLFNFIDGINGYSSSGAIMFSLGLYFFVGDTILLVLVLSTLGFIFWNWGKAKIFMGDVGSTLLGFTIPILIIHYNNTSEFSILNGLILTGVFWFDATFTLFKRFLNKEQLSKAHKNHAYQRIVQYGFSHQKTSLLAIGLHIVLFFLAAISNQNNDFVVMFLLSAMGMLFFVYQLIGTKKPFKK